MRSERPLTKFFDRAFDNEMNTLIEETAIHYDATNYKSALKSGLFDFQNARNWYRDVTGGNMHHDLILRFIKAQALLIAPIAPHWSEYVWRDVLKNVISPQTESANGSLAPFKMPCSPGRRLVRIKNSLLRKSISRVLPIP
jgi:leucyl-tRNA synthetase